MELLPALVDLDLRWNNALDELLIRVAGLLALIRSE